jgi:hypothetical protein
MSQLVNLLPQRMRPLTLLALAALVVVAALVGIGDPTI